MSEIQRFTVVRLLSGVSEHGVPPGARAVVLEWHTKPCLAYEVEVVDDLGCTTFVGAVDPAQVEVEEECQ